jgi:glycosyltransferase involved in cell wall biosynthesis
MRRLNDCVVVMPCLNEGAGIISLVTAVRRWIPDVIVVDDGSRDGTGELAAQAGAEVIRVETTLGKGAALNLGWQRALKSGFAWAMTMDGDGQHSPADIPGFLTAATIGNADLVVGNRLANPEGMPWLRLRVNQWMSRRLSRVAGVDLPDSQCGFRLMKLNSWSTLSLKAEHFEIESEALLAFISCGYAVQFIPVRTIYGSERSKIDPVRDTLRWFRWWRMARENMRTRKQIIAERAKA